MVILLNFDDHSCCKIMNSFVFGFGGCHRVGSCDQTRMRQKHIQHMLHHIYEGPLSRQKFSNTIIPYHDTVLCSAINTFWVSKYLY